MMKKTALLLNVITLLASAVEPDFSLLKSSHQHARLSIPEVRQQPVIDGNIGADWTVYSECTGFAGKNRLLLTGKEGKVRFCRDAEYLYIGVLTSTPSNDPGGSLLTSARERDGAVYSDDSVEFYIHNGKTGYILIANAAGTIYDAKYKEPKNKDAKWNFRDLKIANQVENGWWSLEIAIPLKELENPRSLKMNVIRNWTGLGFSMLNYSPSHTDTKFMFQADLEPGMPAVRETAYGNPAGGEWNFQAFADNLTGRPLEFAVLLGHYGKGGPVADAYRKIPVQPGKTGEIKFDADVRTGNIRLLIFSLRDPESGRVYYSRRVMVQKGPALGRRPATGTFNIPKSGSGQFYLLPGYRKAEVEFKPRSGEVFRSISLQASGQQPVSFNYVKGKWTASLPTPEKAGKYPVSMTLVNKRGDRQTFQNVFMLNIRHFEWENNKIGLDRIILPPFTALKTADGRIENLTSVRKINGLGLYDSLKIEGRELLAAPVSLALKVNEKEAKLRPGTVSMKNENGYSVDCAGSAETDSGITLKTHGYFEYDGFHWLKLTLQAARPVTVDRLTLSIPLKNSEVPLFHASANELRTNPAGNLPKGNGLLWGGSKLPRKKHYGEEMLHPHMVPYLWLGTESRGLSWFMDSSFGCKLDRNKDAVRILRKGDVVTVEVDLINKPVKLSGTRQIEFGFHPTPVKYAPKGVRQTFYDSEGRELPGMHRAQFFLLDFACNFPIRWSKSPARGDYSILRYFTRTLMEGRRLDQKEYLARLKQIHDRDLKILLKFPGGKNNYDRRPQANAAFVKIYTGEKDRGKTLPFAYIDPRLEFMGCPDADYYKSEWWNPAAQNYFAAWRTTLTPSYIDYLVYYLSKCVDAGLHGFFLDDTYLMPDTNPATVAKIDPEGELHSEIGILGLRQLTNRLAVMLHQKNKYPIVLNAHLTDCVPVPSFAKITAQTGFEMKYGETPIPARFSDDYVRAVGLGNQIGANSLILPGIKRKTTPVDQWTEKEHYLQRTVWTVVLLHNLRHTFGQKQDVCLLYRKLVDFGYVADDCKFVPYWGNDPAIQADGVLISSYRRPGKVLVVVGNYHDGKKKTVRLKIDFARLGLGSGAKITDLETGKKVEADNITVDGYDFRLIRIEKQGKGTR